MRAEMRRIAKHQIAAALITAVVGTVVLAGCTDPIPQYAGSDPSLAPPVEQDQNEGPLGSGGARSRAVRLTAGKNIIEIGMDTTEVFCTMRIDVVPVEGDCFASPRIGSGHRRPSRGADPPPPRGHIPSESDSGISHSAISVSIN